MNDFDPSVFFNLSGNSVLDLLNMIKVFNNLEVFFLLYLVYCLILLNINNHYAPLLEKYLYKVLPAKIVSYIMKSINLFQKTGKIYVIIFIVLLGLSIYLSNHYFSFYLDNLDKSCELYLKNK